MKENEKKRRKWREKQRKKRVYGVFGGDISFVYGVGVLGCFFGFLLINWPKKKKRSWFTEFPGVSLFWWTFEWIWSFLMPAFQFAFKQCQPFGCFSFSFFFFCTSSRGSVAFFFDARIQFVVTLLWRCSHYWLNQIQKKRSLCFEWCPNCRKVVVVNQVRGT